MLAGDIAVHRAHAKRRRERKVGQAVVLRDAPHESRACRQSSTHSPRKTCSTVPPVYGLLQIILMLQRLEQVIGIHRPADASSWCSRRTSFVPRGDDIRIVRPVGFGEAVATHSRRAWPPGCRGGRSPPGSVGACSRMKSSDAHRRTPCPRDARYVDAEKVLAALVHAVQADGVEMVGPIWPLRCLIDAVQIVAAIGVEARGGEVLQHLALDLQARPAPGP